MYVLLSALLTSGVVAAGGRANSNAFTATTSIGPYGVNPQMDCAVRMLAWNYSMVLQPERGNQPAVFAALNLGPDCNATLESVPDFKTNIPDYRRKAWSATPVYVDPIHGSDQNSGTEAAPFATIDRALEATRSFPSPGQIILRDGTFYLPAPIELDSVDSGLSIEAYAGETPVLSGGFELPTLAWKAYNISNTISTPEVGITAVDSCVNEPGESSAICSYNGTTPDAATCASQCLANSTCTAYTWHDSQQGPYALDCYFRIDGVWDPEPQSGHTSGYKFTSNVWVASVAGVTGVNWAAVDTLFANNRRAVRARYPNANPETQQKPIGYMNAASWLPPNAEAAHEDIEIPSPSRPFDVFFPTYQWGIGGSAWQFNPPESFWETTNPPAGNHYEVPGGVVWGSQMSPRAGSWSNPTTGIVHAFHGGYWGDWAFEVANFSAASNTIFFGAGGFQEARGSSSGALYYIENIFEEVDMPGEWYFNTTTQMLYYYFNASDMNPSTGTPIQPTFIVSQLQNVLTAAGTQQDPVVDVSLTGLTFAHTATTFMQPFTVPSGGDWSFYKGATVKLTGTENFLVQGCTFWSPGGNGLILADYNRNASILHNEFVYTGESAIVSAGSTQLIDGLNGDYPANSYIAYNLMHEIGIYVKQTGGYYHGISANATLEGNIIFNGPRAGVNINDGFAGGHSLTNNLIFNVVRETGDHGCFNSWDREPYAWNPNNLSQVIPAVSTISQNFFINNYASTWPIDHDDGSNSYVADNNVLAWGGFKNYLGFKKIHVNNLYIYADYSPVVLNALDAGTDMSKYGKGDGVGNGNNRCVMSYGTSSWAPEWRDVWSNNTCIVAASSSIFDWQSGACSPTTPNDGNIPVLANNAYYSDQGNYTFACGSAQWTLTQAQQNGVDIGSSFGGPLSVVAIIGMAKNILKI